MFSLLLVTSLIGCDNSLAESGPRLRILDRQISQSGGIWLIVYAVRYEGAEPLELTASDIHVSYEGWVANSRCAPHAFPRKSEARFCLAEARSVAAPLVVSSNDRLRCCEAVSLSVATQRYSVADLLACSHMPFVPPTIAPGEIVWIALRLEHRHFPYGAYDPLLGERTLSVRLGPCRMSDRLALDAELNPARPPLVLEYPPPERLDSRHFTSAPHSLYLAAHISNVQCYRFPDVLARYSSQVRVRFRYLITPGTEGRPAVRVLEYEDAPNAWSRADGGFDEELRTQGCWMSFVKTFTTQPMTTKIALEFRISNANVGEMWIDDWALKEIGEETDDR